MVTKRADQVEDPVTITDKIAVAIRCLEKRRDQLEQEVYRLDRLGWCEASPYYRDGKYLYLIHPMKDGERKREYIGADQEKIADALARIDRKAEFDKTSNALAEVQHTLWSVKQLLLQAYSAAYAVQW